MGSTDTPNRPVKTAYTMFGIIELLQERDGATLTEVADELDVAKSTAHDHLTTLIDLEYLVRRDDAYHLSLKFLDHGIYAKQERQVARKARPILEELARDTGECAWLLVEETGLSVFLEGVIDERGVAAEERIGLRRPLHCHAAGKAILAKMDDEEVRHVIDRHGLPAHTDRSITDADALFEELATVRDRGYAISQGEITQGLNGVAAGIDIDGLVRGSVAVSGPSKRLQNETLTERLPEAVLGATNALELELTYQ
jgi:DNA-binding IclR family transcriptional regulator